MNEVLRTSALVYVALGCMYVFALREQWWRETDKVAASTRGQLRGKSWLASVIVWSVAAVLLAISLALDVLLWPGVEYRRRQL